MGEILRAVYDEQSLDSVPCVYTLTFSWPGALASPGQVLYQAEKDCTFLITSLTASYFLRNASAPQPTADFDFNLFNPCTGERWFNSADSRGNWSTTHHFSTDFTNYYTLHPAQSIVAELTRAPSTVTNDGHIYISLFGIEYRK